MSDLTDLPGSVGKLEQLVDFLVDVWQSRNWVRRLLVLDVLLVLGLTVVEGGTRLLGLSAPLPDVYKYMWLGAIGAVFLLGLVVAARGRSRAAPAPADIAERAAIKGLVAFELRDAEVFARLQREQELRECLVAVADRNFRFGYLNGDSGSGKTSFLQAGLWPRLMKQGFRCGYVKFSDQDPERTVRMVLAEWIPAADVESAPGLAACLAAAAASENTPLVLLFDQFEQVFVQSTRAHREPFVRELAQWYQEGGGPNSAKILLCLRSDFVGQLVELQKAMGYSLGPQQVFRLEKLDPGRAAAVLSALGEMAGWAVDEVFVEELARQELADPKDGLVSPVDLQVLAWMIAGQRTAEERAFQRDALRKLGGVEGLLERFLKRALAVRETEARRQAAIKVLLLLTDLDQNVRAGLLTAEQLTQKKDGSLSVEDLQEALDWLARSDVRLVARAQRDGETAYELAHERLIPALRRLANQELTDVDRANDLLNRRVNEWLGNARAARYLLTWGEVRLIERMQPYLHWGSQEVPKRELVDRSRQRRNRWLTGAAAVLAIACAVLLWWRSPWGELWRMKRDLAGLNQKISPEKLPFVAAAFTAAGDDSLALQMVEQIPEEDRMEAYFMLAPLSAAAGRPATALNLLERGHRLAEKLENEKERSAAFLDLTYAALDAYEVARDPKLWTKVLAAAPEVAYYPDSIVTTAVDLARKTKDASLLEPFIQVVTDATPHLQMGFEPLIQFAQAARELGTPEQKNELRRALDEQHKLIESLKTSQRAEQLAGMAKFATALGARARALTYVAEARPLLVEAPEHRQSELLWSLDLTTAQLGNKAVALAHLQRDIDQAESMDAASRIEALSRLAKRAAAIGKVDESLRLLSQGITTSAQESLGLLAVMLGEQTGHTEFLDLAVQASQTNLVLNQVVQAAIKLAESNRNSGALYSGVAAADAMNDLKPFLALVKAAADLDDHKLGADLLDRASRVAGSLPQLESQVSAYADLAETAAALQQPEKSTRALLDRGAEIAGQIPEPMDSSPDFVSGSKHHLRAQAFARLAIAAATTGDCKRARNFLDRADEAMQEMERGKKYVHDVVDWWTLANAATEAGDRKRAAELLDKGFAAAEAQRPNDYQSWTFEAMAAARAGEWALARRSTERISDEHRDEALMCILVARLTQDSPNVHAAFDDHLQDGQVNCWHYE